ncbi:MAG: hypothetical protein AABY87_05925 [bacterium]
MVNFKWVILLISFAFIGCATASTTGNQDIKPRIYDIDYDIVFSKAIDTVIDMGWQIISTDKSTGIISFSTPTNLWTWGDNASIRVSKIGNGKIRVDLSSSTQRQIYDWGRNKQNIEVFFSKLDALLNQSKSQTHGDGS